MNRLSLTLSAMVFMMLVGSTYSQVPTAPTNLMVTPGFESSAVLRWDSSATAFGYKVHKSGGMEMFHEIATVRRNEFVDFFMMPRMTVRYYVTALNMSGESLPSDTVVFGFGTPPPRHVFGTIQGMIADELTSQPVAGVVVRFFRFRGWDSMLMAFTDSSGLYRADLDTGRYYVTAGKFGYYPKWYNNVSAPENATPVSVTQGDSTTANFTLAPTIPPVLANVSGTVTDSVAGLPVAGAYVAYLRTFHELREIEHSNSIFGGFGDERSLIPNAGRFDGVLWAGRTDSSGKYTARIPAGIGLIALASDTGYVAKFFKDKRTPFDADGIVVRGDTSGFDFALVHLPEPASPDSIDGTVSDSQGASVPSYVKLVRLTRRGPVLERSRMTDSVGNFVFRSVIPGNFILQAIPVYGYFPSWYAVSGCGVRNWRSADTISVTTSSVSGIDICVEPDSGNGFATIGGSAQGSLRALSWGGSSVVNQGAVVYAISATTNSASSFDIIESDGSFSLENLPPGTYSIVADQEGYSASGGPSYTVDATNGYAIAGASVGFTPDQLLAVNDRQTVYPKEYRLGQNYPNPFNPTTKIGYTLPENSHVIMRIYNVIGQVVATPLDGVQSAGIKSIQFDGSVLPSGVYFYRFQATSEIHSGQQFVQMRKMVLLK